MVAVTLFRCALRHMAGAIRRLSVMTTRDVRESAERICAETA
jgi:hypothetical protein